MEVHHAHHPNHKKKWSEYITEFFMLFFAVTLGFFAENQREHMVENHRAKQYMQSLFEDLKKDTALYNRLQIYDQNQVNKIDTTISLFNANVWNDSTFKLVYTVNLKTLGNITLNINERAASQLKNAGGMRLIQNQELSNKIAAYWELSESIKNAGMALEDLKLRARDQSYILFDQKYYVDVTNVKLRSDVQLMTLDSKTLTEYANRLNHIRNSIANVRMPLIKRLHTQADDILIQLKNEYEF
jgi:hypothetical protein